MNDFIPHKLEKLMKPAKSFIKQATNNPKTLISDKENEKIILKKKNSNSSETNKIKKCYCHCKPSNIYKTKLIEEKEVGDANLLSKDSLEIIDEKIVIIKEIGIGYTSDVYLVKCIFHDNYFALKILKNVNSTEDKIKKHFHSELKALNSCENKSILRLIHSRENVFIKSKLNQISSLVL